MENLWARYEFVNRQSPIPGLSNLVLSLLAGVAGPNYWVQLEFYGPESRCFGISFLATSLDFLSGETNGALTPKLGLLEHLLSRADSHSDQEMPFFTSGTYLGQGIRRTETGAAPYAFPTEGVRRLVLDEDVLIGTSRPFRDTGVGRLHPAGDPWEEGDDDYEYIQLTDQDYQRMIDAGMNIFRVPGDHLGYVLEEPVFFLIRETFENSSELLYRSNFLGSVMYMDEPAWLILSNHLVEQIETPQAAANLLCELTRGRFEGQGNYGQRDLHRLLPQSGYVLSGVDLLQPDYPCWETVASSAWYELEAGIKGWCFESRLQPAWFSGLVKDALDVAFPSDPESCIRYHLGLFSGAATRFNGKWGVAIYGQTDTRTAELLFPMAYRRGASYFWFWTSDRAHHVPFEEQLDHARAFRKIVNENQRGTQDVVQQSHGTRSDQFSRCVLRPGTRCRNGKSGKSAQLEDTVRHSLPERGGNRGGI